MKALFVAFALLISSVANATYYTGNGVIFPDELSKEGLPGAIPCVMKVVPGISRGLICTWLRAHRPIEEWNPKTQRNDHYLNQQSVKCVNGKCATQAYKAGFFPENVDARISIWYYISESSDGKAVAYLFDTGPGFGGDAVTYREAGDMLHAFYVEANLSTKVIKDEMDFHYDGGYAAWSAGSAGTMSKANDKVNEASCSPQLDDNCFVNGVKVPKADLGKYLPVVQESTVEAAGGTCDYPICYDRNDKPIGIKKH
jgi:hypothetical protein